MITMKKKFFYYVKKAPIYFLGKIWQTLSPVLPDKLYLKVLFRLNMGYWMDFNNPKTFSEKLQWLKLYDRKPEYTQMVDKIAVKSYVEGIIGNEYVIPTFGVWNKPEDIEWDTLPNQFVLKTNHCGGHTGVIICKDKATFDNNEAIKKLTVSLKTNVYYSLREWPYKNVKRKVFAEQYIEPDSLTNDLPDYKFFCFNGEPKYCQVISGRNQTMSIDFFDYNWVHQPFHEPKDFPFAEEEPKKPKNLDKMWEIARKLAENKAFSRIDLYDVNNNVYFGEITFFPTSGMGGFNPSKYDAAFGEMIHLL